MKNLFSYLFVVVTIVFAAVSCSKEPSEPTVAVTGVTISPKVISIEVGEQKRLSTTVSPKYATNKEVIFSSSRESAVTVSPDGTVKGISIGKATITVTTKDGNFKDFCSVAVLKEVIRVTGIALNEKELSLEEGDEFTLVPTITPSDASNKSVYWRSTDEDIVTVSSDGVVKAQKEGKAVIVATTVDQEKTATCSVNVAKRKAVTGEATHISCRNAAISGKVNLSELKGDDFSSGVLYSTSSDLSQATFIFAEIFDTDHNFTVNTEALEPETTYYYRSFVVQREDIHYGELKSFKTLATSSMIKTLDATHVTNIDAVLNASLNLTDCLYKTVEYGFEVTPEGKTAHSVMATNLSDNKFSFKDESLREVPAVSYVAYVTLDGRTYKSGVKTFTRANSELIDLGLSVKWSGMNIGASKPEEYGIYFAWGDVIGQTWNGSSWSDSGFSTLPGYELDDRGNLKPEFDAAHVKLGGKWRMPTKGEYEELRDNCTSERTSVNGVEGCLFTSKKDGYTDRSIFLPSAGRGTESILDDAGSYGYYWSSTFANGDAWSLRFFSVVMGGSNRRNGRPVRPVSE